MVSPSDLDTYYETVLELVEQAGQLIASRNNERKTILEKSSDIDLVTETDQEVEKLLIHGLGAKFPDHKFIGEEECSEGKKALLTDEPTWIIDPVDGTMNFVHSFPHSCISIALLVNKTTEIAIILNPLMRQLFTARRGQGTFYNGQRVCVSNQTELVKSLVMAELGTTRDPAKLLITLDNFKKIAENTHGFRALGSAALNMAMVALGAADCNFEYGIHAWDVAAGDLIVREAGGVVIDPAGGPFDIMSRRVLCASSQELANQLSKLLTQFYPEPRD